MYGKKKKTVIGSSDNEPSVELKLEDFEVTEGEYNPKDIVVICDEMGELMNSDDFKSVSDVKEALGSIARLGRAAGFHLVLATQKASSNVISGELMNNIHQSVVMGDFDSGISTLMFEKDISYKCKPEIPGRGFSKIGKEIIEFQAYWTTEDDFEFVEESLFEKAKKKREEEGPTENTNKDGEKSNGEVGANSNNNRSNDNSKSTSSSNDNKDQSLDDIRKRIMEKNKQKQQEMLSKDNSSDSKEVDIKGDLKSLFDEEVSKSEGGLASMRKETDEIPKAEVSLKSAMDESGVIDYSKLV